MKPFLLFCCATLIASLLSAQKIYFVYLQTENNEAFFVRMDDKLYSSSPSGYLILPRLLDSTYNFRLGFPGRDIDLDFSTTINKKDHGYLIKNFGEKGWGLFDLQSLGIQMSSTKVKGTAGINNPNTPVDAFTELLSKAADDPSLKQNVVLVKEEEKKPAAIATVQKEEKKPEATEAVVKEEKKLEQVEPADGKPNEKTTTSVNNVTDKRPELVVAATPEKKSESNPADNKSDEKKMVAVGVNEKQIDSTIKTPEAPKAEEVYKKSRVTKVSGTATREGFESVFVDEDANGRSDTIRLLIPGENTQAIAKEETKRDSVKETKRFLEIDPDTKQMNRPNDEAKKGQSVKWWPFGNPFSKNKNKETSKPESPTNPAPAAKSEESKKWSLFGKNKTARVDEKCQPATNDDFLKLRRKMAERTNDDGMLDEARKYFKEKCFSTEQIKNLSSLFLSNAGKYNFFEVAYKYVTDKENFSSLQSELKDEHYANRFKTLVGN